MAKPTGFMEFTREKYPERPIEERLDDYREIYKEFPEQKLNQQAARCMDCGVPFCHQGCPLGNLIPDWNDLVYQNQWQDAIERLHETNNFPEFTGLLCPAPCEGSCVLGINEPPVTIKYIEYNIIKHAFEKGWVKPQIAKSKTGKKVAVIGSGPAGLACAQQLARAGHDVEVFERADKIGGLLRYGIPDFKMEKHRVEFRVKQMQDEGVVFHTNTNVGENFSTDELLQKFDAVALCGGATVARDLDIEGRNLEGIHLAMDYLTLQNKVIAGDLAETPIHAKDKTVVILGGGDTGADCLGTAHRQGAKKVYQIELMPKPPKERAFENPWPEWPMIYRVASAHAEGGEREYSILTKSFSGENGKVTKLNAVKLEWTKPERGERPSFKEVEGSEFSIEADLVFLALGFTGPQKKGLIEQLGVELDGRGNVKAGEDKRTSKDGIFAAGDMRRGQSLIVWAIAEGRECAKSIDEYLMGQTELS